MISHLKKARSPGQFFKTKILKLCDDSQMCLCSYLLICINSCKRQARSPATKPMISQMEYTPALRSQNIPRGLNLIILMKMGNKLKSFDEFILSKLWLILQYHE